MYSQHPKFQLPPGSTRLAGGLESRYMPSTGITDAKNSVFGARFA
jgi:hypothetical protein